MKISIGTENYGEIELTKAAGVVSVNIDQHPFKLTELEGQQLMEGLKLILK